VSDSRPIHTNDDWVREVIQKVWHLMRWRIFIEKPFTKPSKDQVLQLAHELEHRYVPALRRIAEVIDDIPQKPDPATVKAEIHLNWDTPMTRDLEELEQLAREKLQGMEGAGDG